MPSFSSCLPCSEKKHKATPAASKIRGLKSGDPLDPKLPRFGPIHGGDIEAIQIAKDLAWEHIQLNAKKPDQYRTSIVRIQTEAIESYDTTTVVPGSEFQDKMVKDGCFFLQLVLHILGGRAHLGHSDQHPYFGRDIDSSHWIPAMFFVGNQIPYVVIRALMGQEFFQRVIRDGTWSPPPQELARLVLHRAVVEPELKSPGAVVSPRSDILHDLHCQLLGPGNNDPLYSEMKEFPDLESGVHDDHVSFPSAGGMQRRRNTDNTFPSAGELLKSGIIPMKSNKGVTNIRFRNFMIRACLYVPALTIDRDTEHVLRSVASYEQNLNESDREVTAYFRLMRDLAPTYKDFKILERSGIIDVKDKNFKYTMLITLNQIVDSHWCNFTLNFRDIRRKITNFEKPPWGFISLLLGLITVVNTTFAILSYFHRNK